MWSSASRTQLAEAHPLLRAVYETVGRFWNAVIIDVRRTPAEQAKNVAKGVSQTLDSKHLPQDDPLEPHNNGLSWAVDSLPYPLQWNEIERGFEAVKHVDKSLAVLRAYAYSGFVAGVAAAQGLDLRQGTDWDSDEDFAEHSFRDVPHSELRSTETSTL